MSFLRKEIVDIKSKKITIIGMGETGTSAALLSNHLGADVLLSDLNESPNNLSVKKDLIKYGIDVEIGKHSNDIYDSDLWILSPGVPQDSNIVSKAQKRNIDIISEIEFASWFTNKPIIGLTGSNGKTTTVNMLYEMLKGDNYSPILAGNMGFAFSRAILNDLNKKTDDRIYILELSSFQLENIIHFKPFISIILNITPDHQDRYIDMNAYVEAKLNIIANQDSNDFLIYNSDDPILNKRCKNAVPKILSFSINNNSENLFKIRDSKIIEGDSHILDLSKIALAGKHNLSNFLAASTAAKILNISNRQISETISNFSGIEHRLEKVVINNGVAYYNDSKATNIESVIAAIQSFSNSVILILGGKDKDSNFVELIPFIKHNVKKIISYGQASKKIAIALRDAVELDQVSSLRDAVEVCHKSAVPGDIVLLSPGCASFDQFNNYEERGNEFKKIVNEMAQA
tara:strand:+ start:534 stop:1910 length:1377 start_codon:yes stop_codon:yes gene_type:complete